MKMNTKITAVLSLLVLLCLTHPLSGQQANNPFYANYVGVGYTGAGFTKNMKLSTFTVGVTHIQSFGSVNNNAISVIQSGVYNLIVFAGVTGGDITAQELGYKIYINNNLVASVSHAGIPSTGIYVVQKNLNQGDTIVVAVSKNFDFTGDTGNNRVTLSKS